MSTLKVNAITETDGSAFPLGTILQVITAFKDNSATIATSSMTTDSHAEVSADLRVDITPKSTSSKILIICNIHQSAVAGITTLRIQRTIGSGTPAFIFNHASSNAAIDGCAHFWVNNNPFQLNSVFCYIDSPNTTSQVRYSPFLSNGVNVQINRIWNNDNHRGTSSVICQEISA